jgi:N-acetylglucosamine-6-phosphate deacetylase
MTDGSFLRLDADAAVLPQGLATPASILVDVNRGVIAAAGAPRDVGHVATATVERVHGTLIPGFVELQVNGAAGHDFRDPDATGAVAALRALLDTGVTTCCPTMPTQPADRYLPAMAAVAGAFGTAMGPRVPGVHLEGPFLAAPQRGAHRMDWLQAPSLPLMELLLGEGAVPVSIWTVAPELEGALDLIRALASAGVVVSAGHTGADADVLDAAVDAGVSMVTHLCNGMPPFHHRRPGPVGWALAHPTVRAGLILDGHHVDPSVLGLLRTLLGPRSFGVTDAVATLGLAPGRHEVDGTVIDTTTGVARLGAPDGPIAGATVGMDRMIVSLCEQSGDLVDLVRLCCTSPADAIGRADLGRLGPGAAADILELDDHLAVRRVWLGGCVVAGTI